MCARVAAIVLRPEIGNDCKGSSGTNASEFLCACLLPACDPVACVGVQTLESRMICTGQTPMDFFMRGKQANGEDVGLSTIPGYALRTVLLKLPGKLRQFARE